MLHLRKQQVDLSLSKKLTIAHDIAIVYLYMHNLGIVHRDIKSHNVLIDHNMSVKICDFGLAKFTVSSFNYLFLSFVYRLIWAKVLCNLQALLHTWLLNFSRKDLTTKLLMSMLLVAYFGRSLCGRYHSLV